MLTRLKKMFHKNNKSGFTLVEVIIAVAVLGIVTAPILAAFVMTSRMNYKGRQKEQSMTVAQNLVEGVKARGISGTLSQIDSSNTTFNFIPENSSGAKISHSIVSSVVQSSVIHIEDYELMNSDTITADINVDCREYVLKVNNILMGHTYYDGVITITPNYDKDYVVSYYYSSVFNKAGMSNLKYFDVKAEVTLHDETNVLATYEGTFLDQKNQ